MSKGMCMELQLYHGAEYQSRVSNGGEIGVVQWVSARHLPYLMKVGRNEMALNGFIDLLELILVTPSSIKSSLAGFLTEEEKAKAV